MTGVPTGAFRLKSGGELQANVAVTVPTGAPTAFGTVSLSGYCVAFLEHGRATCDIPDSDFKVGKVALSIAYQGDPTYRAVTAKEPSFTAVVPPAFTTSDTTKLDVLKKLSFVVKTTGSPAATIIEAGRLPKGVTFGADGSGGALLSGTPVRGSQGSYPIRLTASNGIAVVQHFTLAVLATRPSITSASTVRARVGNKLSFVIRSSGTPTAVLTESGKLPKGMEFTVESSGRATLAGTPGRGTQGSYRIKITAKNGVGSAAVQHLTLKVSSP